MIYVYEIRTKLCWCNVREKLASRIDTITIKNTVILSSGRVEKRTGTIILKIYTHIESGQSLDSDVLFCCKVVTGRGLVDNG